MALQSAVHLYMLNLRVLLDALETAYRDAEKVLETIPPFSEQARTLQSHMSSLADFTTFVERQLGDR